MTDSGLQTNGGDWHERELARALHDARPQPDRSPAFPLAMRLLLSRTLGTPAPRLGRFELLAKVGQGGMGAVFAAWDPALQRRVALKLVSQDHDHAQLEREARALARLNHPNVLAVYELAEDGDARWLVTELIDGSTLCEASAHAPWRRLVRWCCDVAAALSAAHDAGLVHCDVKPENLLVDTNGRVRVADFGLALSGVRALESVGGTAGYVAPELHAGAPPSPASDQYAFCVTLAVLLGDRDVPAELRAVIGRGRSADVRERWPSMRAVERALDDVLAGRGLAGRGRAPKAQRPVRSAAAGTQLAPLLELVRHAPDLATLRREALAWLDRELGFDTALLGDPARTDAHAPLILGFDAAFVAQFAAAPERYGPTLGQLVGASASSGLALRDTDVFTLHERSWLPFYAELIGPKGSREMLHGSLVVGGAVIGSVQLSRAGRGARFRERELRLLNAALPWLALSERAFGGGI